MTLAEVFFAFRDAPDRRAALQRPSSLDRYRLFGLDQIAERGVCVHHNLERQTVPPWATALGRAVNALIDGLGGVGGDFSSVLASRAKANETDVVFSTVDTVGIPLLLLKRASLLRPPLVYTSIGFPERLVRLRNDRARSAFKDALGRAHTVIAYSRPEADFLRGWTDNVVFVPFGVDIDAFAPPKATTPTIDVLSVGADPLRDFGLLLDVASRARRRRFHIVTTATRTRELGTLPPNVSVEADVTLEVVRERYAQAGVVALPVRDNTYSGATTTLLQAMSMAKPVVVSRTDAIADGYELQDGVNCRLVPPGDGAAFDAALESLLDDEGGAAALGMRARETVVRHFSWMRYTDAIWNILRTAVENKGPDPVAGSGP